MTDVQVKQHFMCHFELIEQFYGFLPLAWPVDVQCFPSHSSSFFSSVESSRPSKNSAAVVSKQSARWQVSKELYQTESNYVGILNTVLQVQLPLSIYLAL